MSYDLIALKVFCALPLICCDEYRFLLTDKRTAGRPYLHFLIYRAAIIGTATSVATMPTVFHRVKCSPRKKRASNTVSAG